MGLGVPFDIASYALLTYMIAHLTDLLPGKSRGSWCYQVARLPGYQVSRLAGYQVHQFEFLVNKKQCGE